MGKKEDLGRKSHFSERERGGIRRGHTEVSFEMACPIRIRSLIKVATSF